MFEQEFLQDLEPYILENFAVSSDRKDTGVCGLSMGGMEALHLGLPLKIILIILDLFQRHRHWIKVY